MKTAREICRQWQLVCPKDSHKSYYIIRRDPVGGDIAAEVALSGWSGEWLVAVYNDKKGARHDLWVAGLKTRAIAIWNIALLKSGFFLESNNG